VRLWADEHMDTPDRERFRKMVEMELLNLSEGNFARVRLRPREFDKWQETR